MNLEIDHPAGGGTNGDSCIVAVPMLRSRLAAALVAAMGATAGPADWATDNCMIFCADIYRAALGVDPAAPFRGRWSSPRGMRRVLVRDGFASPDAAAAATAVRMGWREIVPAAAETGDAGLIAVGNARACAIRHPSGFWVARGAGGWAALGDEFCPRAWSIA